MSNFFSDPTSCRIATEADLISIISNLSEDNTKDIIEANIQYRMNNYEISNLVDARERELALDIENFGPESPITQEILCNRAAFHEDILEDLGNRFGVKYIGPREIDLYTAASVLYNLLVSNFKSNLINFFSNYILAEKKYLYNEMILARFKKQKDSSTLYNKQSVVDQEMALILANLDFVLANMEPFPFDFNMVINYMFMYNKSIAAYITSNFTAPDNFYAVNIYSLLKSSYRANIITDVILNLNSVVIKNTTNPLNIQ